LYRDKNDFLGDVTEKEKKALERNMDDKFLSMIFEEKIKNSPEYPLIRKIVDDGKDRSRDYYEGAERVAHKATYLMIESQGLTPETVIWSGIAGYCTYKKLKTED
jgi:hypothetical protein